MHEFSQNNSESLYGHSFYLNLIHNYKIKDLAAIDDLFTNTQKDN